MDDAKARGARVVLGGERPRGKGYFYPLTILADATDDMRVVSEEQFGPVIPILKYDEVEDAVRRANASNTGLGGSVWGNDLVAAAKTAARLECGTVWINNHGDLNPLAPFGGIKQSGLGVEFGVDGLREFTTVQVIHTSPA